MYVDDAIHIEKSDQCYTCEHFVKGVMCPLLEALALNVVELTTDMTVQNCSFYKQYNRHLRVIDRNKAAEEVISSIDEENKPTDDGDNVIRMNP